MVQVMIQWGVWEPNDARERMQMNPIDGDAADSTWMQINMAPTDQLYETPALPGAAGDDESGEDDLGGDTKPAAKKNTPAGKRERLLITRISRAYSRLFRDAFGRVSARSHCDLKTFRQVFLPVLASIGEELDTHATQMFGADPSPDGLESSRFLTGYLETMFHRFESEAWASANGHAKEICGRELTRAIRALAVECYRNAATAAAKEETETEVES
jgi:hypothetical protein